MFIVNHNILFFKSFIQYRWHFSCNAYSGCHQNHSSTIVQTSNLLGKKTSKRHYFTMLIII